MYSQPTRGLAPGEPLQFTQHNRRPEVIRETGDLLIERAECVLVGQRLFLNGAVRDRGDQRFARPTTEEHRAGLPGGPDGHPVDECPDSFPRADINRPAGEDEECDLEGVVGQMRVADPPPANRADHRPKAGDQGRKRGLVACPNESRDELPIGHIDQKNGPSGPADRSGQSR